MFIQQLNKDIDGKRRFEVIKERIKTYKQRKKEEQSNKIMDYLFLLNWEIFMGSIFNC